MTDSSDKYLEAISKLITLTQNGEIKWYAVDPGKVKNRRSDSDVISTAFRAEYDNKILQLYSRRYKVVTTPLGALSFFSGARDSSELVTRWKNEACLELVSQTGELLWEFPREEILNDLIEAVKFKVSGAGDLIQRLLDR